MNNDNYINTIYNSDSRPVTSYPDELAKYLKKRFCLWGVLIDLGCGRGDFLKAFQRAGLEAIGLDGEKGLEKSDIVGGIDFEKDKLPFDDSSVDIIFSKSVLEHIHKPDTLMKECNRILKPGGRIIAMVPDWQTCMYIYYDDHTHVQPYTVNGLGDLLRIYGYNNVTSELFYQLPIVWRHPTVKIVSKALQFFGPVKKISKNKFYRFSRELMVLATGIK